MRMHASLCACMCLCKCIHMHDGRGSGNNHRTANKLSHVIQTKNQTNLKNPSHTSITSKKTTQIQKTNIKEDYSNTKTNNNKRNNTTFLLNYVKDNMKG